MTFGNDKENGPLWYCTTHGLHRYWVGVNVENISCGHCRDEKPARPSWDHYYLTIAYTVAKRATCPRASVGAVLVKDNHIIATGFNGAVRGLPHCTEVGCLMLDGHCARAVHAECNAIIQAALHGVSTAGATAYITHYPCLNCAKMLVNAGITRVVYGEVYRQSQDTVSILEIGAGVECIKYEQQ
jgi:dCMP deaminase